MEGPWHLLTAPRVNRLPNSYPPTPCLVGLSGWKNTELGGQLCFFLSSNVNLLFIYILWMACSYPQAFCIGIQLIASLLHVH